jgi:signal peptidase I
METDPIRVKGISGELLGSGMDVRVSTRGLSMFPLISTGDKITIHPEKDYEMGELIVFKRDGQMVCHRLVKVFEKDDVRYYQTRGDSFFGLDEPVTADQILGTVTKIDRGKVSFVRRMLLLLYPALKFGKLNAFLIAVLI